MTELDHLVVVARDLDEGCAHVAAALGVDPGPGGQHPAMGTHNRLISLGRSYLEVIAIDPSAPAPDHPRWFGLDGFDGAPMLAHWVVRCTDIDAALAGAPKGAGRVLAQSRGDLRWQIAVPQDGQLPFDGCFPGLIEWLGDAHPVDRMPDSGCRLHGLTVTHPDAALARAVTALDPMLGGYVTSGAAPGLRADIATPHGIRSLT